MPDPKHPDPNQSDGLTAEEGDTTPTVPEAAADAPTDTDGDSPRDQDRGAEATGDGSIAEPVTRELPALTPEQGPADHAERVGDDGSQAGAERDPANGEVEATGAPADGPAAASGPEPESDRAAASEKPAAKTEAERDEKPAPAPVPASSGDPEAPSSGRGLAWLALLLALGSAGFTGYQEMQRREAVLTEAPSEAAVGLLDTSEIESRLAEATTAAETKLGDLRDALDDVSGRVGSVQAAVQSVRDEVRAVNADSEATRATVTAVEARVTGRSNRIDTLEADVRRLGEEVRNAVREARTVTEEVRASVQDMAGVEGRTRSEINRLDQRFDSIQQAVSALAEYEQGGEAVLLVAEAEFLLRLASERLQLFRDPTSAVAALKLAASHLRAVDDPIYAGVRRTLTGEIERLGVVNLPDLAELSGRIGALADASDRWPLDERRSLDRSANVLSPEENEDGWWARFRAVASEVAVVHRDTGEGTLMLTLEEERLLRENIRLQLQVAQLAAIRGDTQLYGAAIAKARRWLESYYDLDQDVVTAAIADLQTLETIDVAPPLPEIGEAFSELRRVRTMARTADDAP